MSRPTLWFAAGCRARVRGGGVRGVVRALHALLENMKELAMHAGARDLTLALTLALTLTRPRRGRRLPSVGRPSPCDGGGDAGCATG